MTGIRDEARQFWSASYFMRRAPERDTKQAIKVLRKLARSKFKEIALQARSILEELT